MNSTDRRNRRTMLTVLAVAGGMLGLSFASVPLYSLFCKVTGFDGTPQVAEGRIAPGAPAHARIFRIEFNADTNPALPWDFVPEQRAVTVQAGESQLIAYRATNRSDHSITGTALFNVTPEKAASYFVKTECFCFQKQTLTAGQTMDFPVMFYIDPDIANDRNLDDVSSITLSYTFYPDRSDALARAKAAVSQPVTDSKSGG